MRYYLNTSTQSIAENGGYNEYGKKETTGLDEAGLKKAEKDMLTSSATALQSSSIQYYIAKVEDSKGNVLKKYEVGKYIEWQSEPEIEEENEE